MLFFVTFISVLAIVIAYRNNHPQSYYIYGISLIYVIAAASIFSQIGCVIILIMSLFPDNINKKEK
jgi:hypothetical protein